MKPTLGRKRDESTYKCLEPTKRHKTLITTGSKTMDANPTPPQKHFYTHIYKYVGRFAITRYLKGN
jgi:hypothetical protein